MPGTDPNFRSDEMKVEFQQQTYLIKKIEGDIWIAVLLRLEETDKLNHNDGFQEFASNNSVNLFRDRVGFEFIEKFYRYWHMFYGKLDHYL